jgi:hypothetical protein
MLVEHKIVYIYIYFQIFFKKIQVLFLNFSKNEVHVTRATFVVFLHFLAYNVHFFAGKTSLIKQQGLETASVS